MPQEKRWLAADNVALLVDHIHTLRVRGAPLIGLSASLLLALLAQRGLNRDALQQRWRRCARRGRRRST